MGERCFSLDQVLLIGGGIDLRDDVTFLNLGIVVDVELFDDPEIWLPTWTFFTGLSEPLAITSWTMSPRDTVAVRN